jgi:hypothetical protein
MEDFSKKLTNPITKVASEMNSPLLHSRVPKTSLGNKWVVICGSA